jgi:ribose transport system substrate-binding protein
MGRNRWTSARRTGIACVAAAALALALGACGDDDDGGGGGGSGGGGGTPGGAAAQDLALFEGMDDVASGGEVDTSKFKSDKDKFTIGFSDVSLVNSWRVQARKSAEIKAEEWGVDLKVTDAGGDAKKQISDIEDLLTQGVDALVVSPAAPKPLAPIIERAAGTGIPVILWSGRADTDQYTSEIVADDRYFGEVGGEYLCDVLGGKGNVIALRGIAGISVETDRYEGAKSKMDACGLKIVGEEYGDWAFAKGKKAAENLLAAHSDIQGVWSSGADMTRGAIQAFQEANRDLVPMTGEPLNGFLKLWKKDKLKSVAPPYEPWQGAEAVKLAILALQGKPISKDYVLKSPPVTDETLDDNIRPNDSDDFWIDQGYLNDDEIAQLFAD